MEKTLVLIKPDAVNNKYVGKIIAVYEENRFDIEKIKILIPDERILSDHYREHIGKDFYPQLIDFMKSGRVVAMILAKTNAVEDVRKINGHTDPLLATEGTVRKLFGTSITMNAVHGSATLLEAKREMNIWF
ncbi:MAG: nucleoside-diphosphate kinase [Tissierellales bacterium]|nr:nucleoside-diphosphate kinase [Tissierellales bacterium]MBN2827290.1 nucleoside-diphosphate kinase [Tissierellales bacterium]